VSIDVFAYQDIEGYTFDHFIIWFQKKFNLRDWRINVIITDDAPEKFGGVGLSPAACIPQYQFLDAEIWVSPMRAATHNAHPLELLCHELVHILFTIIVDMDGELDNPNDDIVVTRLEGPILELYYRNHGKTLPKYRE